MSEFKGCENKISVEVESNGYKLQRLVVSVEISFLKGFYELSNHTLYKLW